MTGNCPQCGTRLLPGALACINRQLPLTPAPVPAPTPPDPATATPAPTPYGYVPGYPPPAPWAPQPAYPPGYYPVQPYGPNPWSTNGMSIASLVLSVLWLGGVGSLLGVIFGHVSRGQLRRRAQRGEGIARAGLIIGYLGLVGSVVFWASLPRIIDSGLVQNALVQQDIRGAASAENSYYRDTGSYTGDRVGLSNVGFNPLGHNTISVAFTTDGYCIVGTRDNANAWYLYDSAASGLLATTFPSEPQAQAACSVPGATSYSTIN